MPESQFLNFKKLKFSHQVAIVGHDQFTIKSANIFSLTTYLNLDMTCISTIFPV